MRTKLSARMIPGLSSDGSSTTPAMAVSVPGMQPVTIGCRNFTGLKRRFSWVGTVSVTNDPPAYEISPADWLTLVEKLGLASHLQDTAK